MQVYTMIPHKAEAKTVNCKVITLKKMLLKVLFKWLKDQPKMENYFNALYLECILKKDVITKRSLLYCETLN